MRPLDLPGPLPVRYFNIYDIATVGNDARDARVRSLKGAFDGKLADFPIVFLELVKGVLLIFTCIGKEKSDPLSTQQTIDDVHISSRYGYLIYSLTAVFTLTEKNPIVSITDLHTPLSFEGSGKPKTIVIFYCWLINDITCDDFSLIRYRKNATISVRYGDVDGVPVMCALSVNWGATHSTGRNS
ncbi:hypothetical protein TcasGA2_TC008174 [Tribolium castaneum]|uniref:Uncharacterized protein n=1 Tax=Tribolium castaneum TaxID=7070 RepID=D2A080_TRICA|nr:hypothetical protein TcasGA2_TC008174 [Tribolium castaneum]